MSELRLYEKKVLLALKELNGKASIDAIAEKSGLAHAAVMRAALSLSEKGMIKLYEQKMTIATLNDEGWSYLEKGLPERRLLKAIIELGGRASIEEASKKASLPRELASIALGWLCRKGWATIEEGICISKIDGEPPSGSDEELMKLLAERGKVSIEYLNQEQNNALGILKKRKLVNLNEKVQRFLELTDAGWKIIEKGIEIAEEVTQLTPELIITGKWRRIRLAKFDVEAPTPPVYPGKAHPLQQIIKRAREIFLEMGFTEIRGPLVETAFWNFDALFQPQDHPAREMMDTFYLVNPSMGKLPRDSLVKAVAQTHENGWITGSKGWGYRWNPMEA
ncbi:MAG: phenylalanine--tRNA ligase subunit alpha, partial [Candidatus Bathyarchaeia archaeon]